MPTARPSLVVNVRQARSWSPLAAAELDKGSAPFTLMPNVGEDSEQWAAERLAQRVGLLAAGLADRPHLDGERFTVADACAFWALRMYHRLLHVDLPAPFDRYLDRVGARLAVHEALTAEGMSF